MEIYFATGNSGNVEHAQNILSDCDVKQVDVETVEPQSASIEEISLSKVEQAVEKSAIEEDAFLIADDSGLFLGELNGFPGPLSSPFDSMVGKERLLDLVDEGAEAEFRAAIAIYIHGEKNRVSLEVLKEKLSSLEVKKDLVTTQCFFQKEMMRPGEKILTTKKKILTEKKIF